MYLHLGEDAASRNLLPGATRSNTHAIPERYDLVTVCGAICLAPHSKAMKRSTTLSSTSKLDSVTDVIGSSRVSPQNLSHVLKAVAYVDLD